MCLLLRDHVCMVMKVCCRGMLRGADRAGRRVGEGWRDESFSQRQLRVFLCSVAKCNWKAFKYWCLPGDFVNMNCGG
jgi:hypothetical protein